MTSKIHLLQKRTIFEFDEIPIRTNLLISSSEHSKDNSDSQQRRPGCALISLISILGPGGMINKFQLRPPAVALSFVLANLTNEIIFGAAKSKFISEFSKHHQKVHQYWVGCRREDLNIYTAISCILLSIINFPWEWFCNFTSEIWNSQGHTICMN